MKIITIALLFKLCNDNNISYINLVGAQSDVCIRVDIKSKTSFQPYLRLGCTLVTLYIISINFKFNINSKFTMQFRKLHTADMLEIFNFMFTELSLNKIYKIFM